MMLMDDILPVIDMDALYRTEPVLSDDIWKKFELDFQEFSGFEDIFQETKSEASALNSILASLPALPQIKIEDDLVISEIRNHDCMWAGHCASKEHPADEPRHALCAPILLPPPAAAKREEAARPAPHPQSLLKPALRAAPPAVAPQTPPMSDDEETRSKPTQVLQILNEAISECDLEDDSDLCEYFEDGEDIEVDVEGLPPPAPVKPPVEPKPEVRPEVRTLQHAAKSDHSYHKDKNASMRVANFGLDTPSDSEEEIDVVSVGEKFTAATNSSLPTNPSTKDRQQIQRRMATAIGKKQITSGIKTILPIRKAQETTTLAKRRTPAAAADAAGSRGVKRQRQQYRAAAGSPYKRRHYGHSSDDEPEPSEKRSLHNNMERQRRIDLRNAFEDLRLLVPEVSKKERAAKVVILREAAQYCDFLGNVSFNYTRQLEDLKRHQERLRGRVSQLRRSLAAKR